MRAKKKCPPRPVELEAGENRTTSKSSPSSFCGQADSIPNPLLDAAIRYAEQGFRVLPLEPRAKKPAGRLVKNGVHGATTDLCTIHTWWQLQPAANVGIACGIESGLVVVDVDPRNGGLETLRELTRHHGPFPKTVTVTTGRGDGGQHWYFRHPGGRVKNGKVADGIDVKCDGGYVVAPPSIHPDSDKPYVGDIDRASFAEAPSWLINELHTSTPPHPPIASVSLSHTSTTPLCHTALCPTEPGLSVTQAIEATIPTDIGHRNRGIFEFARHLKAIPKYADANANDLRSQVRTWHDRALPFIGTKSFDETWSDFVYAWQRVRYPKGTGPLADCLSRARAAPLPTAPSRYEDAILRLLVVFCAELQRSSGESPFFLSCRSLGGLLGMDRMTAFRRLNLLVHDGVLVVAQLGTAKRATRFFYVKRCSK